MWNLSLWRQGGVPTEPALPVPPALRGAVYIEPLPPAFHAAIDREPPSHAILGAVYKVERILLELVRASEARTDDATAPVRWVPVFVSALDRDGRPGRDGSKAAHAQRKVAELRAALRMLPRWRPEHEHEHVVVAAMDRGRCFQHDGAPDVHVDLLGNATVIMYEGDSGETYARGRPPAQRGGRPPAPPFPCFRPGVDIVVPPVVDVGALSSGVSLPATRADAGGRARLFSGRTLLAVWHGTVNHSRYSAWGETSLRESLLRLARPAPPADHAGGAPPSEVRIGAPVPKPQYFAEMRRSLFCLCPPGWATWTPRYFEAIQVGCLPVTFRAVGLGKRVARARARERDPAATEMPFEDSIDYAAFTVNVFPDAAGGTLHALAALAARPDEVRRMQRALWEARAKLDWTDLERGPFRLVMEALAARRAAR